jgi:hypothetical protein
MATDEATLPCQSMANAGVLYPTELRRPEQR